MAENKEGRLKSLKDDLERQEKRLVEDYMNSAVVVHLLAPLRHEIALLEDELKGKNEASDDGAKDA